MYFNNVHILNFVIAALLGLVVGKFIAWCNLRIPEKKKVFSREFSKGIPFDSSNFLNIIKKY